MDAKQVEREMKKLVARKSVLQNRIHELQSECPHTAATRTAKADTGNWCPSDDSYWFEFRCPHCGKFWTTPQS